MFTGECLLQFFGTKSRSSNGSGVTVQLSYSYGHVVMDIDVVFNVSRLYVIYIPDFKNKKIEFG